MSRNEIGRGGDNFKIASALLPSGEKLPEGRMRGQCVPSPCPLPRGQRARIPSEAEHLLHQSLARTVAGGEVVEGLAGGLDDVLGDEGCAFSRTLIR